MSMSMSRRVDSSESEDLFFPSPSPPLELESARHGRRTDDEVAMLVEKASQTNTMTPAVANFMARSGDKYALLGLVRRQIDLIMSRSQDFGDSQVTIFDKALVQLTRNGRELDQPTVVQYFAEHFLGIPMDGRPGSAIEASRALERAVQVEKRLKSGQKQAGVATRAQHADQDTDKLARGRRESETGSHSARTLMNPGTVQGKGIHMEDAQLARLWDLYATAKQDFSARSNNNNPEKLMPAAKFLRDTAENTIQYLKDKHIDAEMEGELHATYNMAKATVVSLSGGKKRKFDLVDMSDLKNAPRGPSMGTAINVGSFNHSSFERRPRRQFGPGAGMGIGGPVETLAWSDARSLDASDMHEPAIAGPGGDVHSTYPYGHSSFNHHTYDEATRGTGGTEYGGARPRDRDSYRPGHQRMVSSRRRRSGDGSPERQQSANVDRGRAPLVPPPPPPPPRGRGHSGIPFGYSREVDSYQPAKDSQRHYP